MNFRQSAKAAVDSRTFANHVLLLIHGLVELDPFACNGIMACTPTRSRWPIELSEQKVACRLLGFLHLHLL